MAAAQKSNDNKKKKREKARPVVIVLIVLVTVALIGLIGFFATRDRSTPPGTVPENFVSYPTVSSSIASSKDGKPHTIDVDLVVEYEDGAHASVPHSAVYDIIAETVASLDYERLRDIDSVEHIEETVKKSISGLLGDETVSEVYVGNIAIDFHSYFIENSKPADADSSGKLKGLFKNLKD